MIGSSVLIDLICQLWQFSIARDGPSAKTTKARLRRFGAGAASTAVDDAGLWGATHAAIHDAASGSG